jgi:pSer/pThr/pTyr-binding forkhead associated (FHA) protein
MGITITIMSGAEDGKLSETDKTQIMLGRHPDDDICLLYDNRVSEHHARIIEDSGSYFIEDVGSEGKGSRNGTYIEGYDKKIILKTSISPGQLILLGYVWVKFDVR